jgi:fructokinase
MEIVCLGELLIDMLPTELGRGVAEVSAWLPKPGGAPANVAVAASRLGAESAFVGKVGDEAFGHYLAGVLGDEGVDVSGVRYDEEARTGLAFIAKPDENSYDILFYRNPGADMRLRPGDLDGEMLSRTRAFHFGSISLIQEPSRSATLEAIRLAREGGALISFDVNYRANLWSRDKAREQVRTALGAVDLVKVNGDELELLTRSSDLDEGSQELLAQGVEVCVVTLGSEGSYFRVAQGGGTVAPFRVDTVDATGCGDAFVAGLLWQLVRGGDWRGQLEVARMREVLRYANAVGALTSTRAGAIPALPTAQMVDEFLAGER